MAWVATSELRFCGAAREKSFLLLCRQVSGRHDAVSMGKKQTRGRSTKATSLEWNGQCRQRSFELLPRGMRTRSDCRRLSTCLFSRKVESCVELLYRRSSNIQPMPAHLNPMVDTARRSFSEEVAAVLQMSLRYLTLVCSKHEIDDDNHHGSGKPLSHSRTISRTS